MNATRVASALVSIFLFSSLLACGSGAKEKSNTNENVQDRLFGQHAETTVVNKDTGASSKISQNYGQYGESYIDVENTDKDGNPIDSVSTFHDQNQGTNYSICNTSTVTSRDDQGRAWGFEDGKSCKSKSL